MSYCKTQWLVYGVFMKTIDQTRQEILTAKLDSNSNDFTEICDILLRMLTPVPRPFIEHSQPKED